jgi:hypothetical protein
LEGEVARLKEQLAQPEQEADELTIAYMSGLYDGKKAQRTEQEPDDIASIIACRNMLDAQPVPPRSTEQNFCPRCGKRTNDIHTCTPPRSTEPPQKKVWTFWDLSGGDITDAIIAKLKEKNQ